MVLGPIPSQNSKQPGSAGDVLPAVWSYSCDKQNILTWTRSQIDQHVTFHWQLVGRSSPESGFGDDKRLFELCVGCKNASD
jgi:hypothetical protein